VHHASTVDASSAERKFHSATFNSPLVTDEPVEVKFI
jgi:hypothetical protein